MQGNPILNNQRNSGSSNSSQSMSQLNPQVFQPLKNVFNQIKAAQNPQAMLNQMLMGNPQLKPALDFIRANGGNAQTAFMNLAKQMGADPQQILNQFK